MIILLFGPPGSGKGTQAELIKKECNINHISTGDIIREEVKKNTPLSKIIKTEIKNGKLINDKIIVDLIEKYIITNKKILLDGFPRTLEQAEFLSQKNFNIEYIINIKTEKQIIFKRIKYRILKNNKNYNILYNKPKIKNKDNITGEYLIKRPDDLFNIIDKRLKDYYNNLDKILNLYKNKIKIIEINGENNINKIFEEIKINIRKII